LEAYDSISFPFKGFLELFYGDLRDFRLEEFINESNWTFLTLLPLPFLWVESFNIDDLLFAELFKNTSYYY
jgi:hypothetical protein